MKVDKLHSKIFKDCFYREKTFQEHLLEDKLLYQGLHNFTHYKFAIKKRFYCYEFKINCV